MGQIVAHRAAFPHIAGAAPRRQVEVLVAQERLVEIIDRERDLLGVLTPHALARIGKGRRVAAAAGADVHLHGTRLPNRLLQPAQAPPVSRSAHVDDRGNVLHGREKALAKDLEFLHFKGDGRGGAQADKAQKARRADRYDRDRVGVVGPHRKGLPDRVAGLGQHLAIVDMDLKVFEKIFLKGRRGRRKDRIAREEANLVDAEARPQIQHEQRAVDIAPLALKGDARGIGRHDLREDVL